MKISEGFVLKNIAGTYVVVPVGENTVSFKAIITLNETGAFLWEHLQKECTEETLLESMLKEYNVEKEIAAADIKEFIQKLEKATLLT